MELITILHYLAMTEHLVWRIVKKMILITWWRKYWGNYVQKTITHERFNLKVQSDALIPYLRLSWRLANRSETHVKICRVFGDLYSGNWHFTSFDTDRVLDRQVGYIWVPPMQVSKRIIKKGDISGAEIELNLVPPMEFWLEDIHECVLRNAGVQIDSFWGKAISSVPKDIEPIAIKGIDGEVIKYRESIKAKLRKILADEVSE